MMEYGLIGERLSHSYSQLIHNRLFGYEYELREIPRDELSAFLKKREFRAVNVTIPYKEAVMPHLDHIDETAREIGAVNVILNQNGVLSGYNTDLFGIESLFRFAAVSPEGKKVMILGGGGTAKTAAAAVKKLGCREIVRVSRSEKPGFVDYNAAETLHRDSEIIINATPCGMYPDIGVSALDISHFSNLSGVIDAIYNPLRPALVLSARDKKIPSAGGLYMLVAQAARAAELFTGKTVPQGRIDEIYREIFLSVENIVLVGMPGSGKTTVGRMLARSLGFDFVDSDEEIIAREGVTIAEIFARSGEQGFREIEKRVIKQLAARKHTVIATGGGAVLSRENVDLLRENGRIYFLDRDPANIEVTADRPLSSSREALMTRYRERYDIYLASSDKKTDANAAPDRVSALITEDFFNENTCY